MHKHLHLPFQSHLNKAEILWEHELNKLISDLSSRPHTSVLLLFTPQVHDLLSPNSSPASRSTHLIALLSDQLHPPSAADRQTGDQSSRAEWDCCTTATSCQAAQLEMKLKNESRDPPGPRDLTSWKPTVFSVVQRNVRYITLSLQSLSWRLCLKLTQCVNRGNTSAATVSRSKVTNPHTHSWDHRFLNNQNPQLNTTLPGRLVIRYWPTYHNVSSSSPGYNPCCMNPQTQWKKGGEYNRDVSILLWPFNRVEVRWLRRTARSKYS